MLDIKDTFKITLKGDVNKYTSFIESCKNEYKNLCEKVNSTRKKNKRIKITSVILIIILTTCCICFLDYFNNFLPSTIISIIGAFTSFNIDKNPVTI